MCDYKRNIYPITIPYYDDESMGKTILTNQINVLYLENDSQKKNDVFRTINTKRNTKNDTRLPSDYCRKVNDFKNQVSEIDLRGY